ncbi:MAG: sugar phosphate isomerase/epimerase [Clostridia bacterium]|nr:sugar phosphate isomerase/epimerase [Clostridia bacterium]
MKISVQSQRLTGQYGIREAYRMIREAGFEAIDWNIDTEWSFKEVTAAEKLEGLCIFERSQEEIDAYFAEELAAIRENGLEITQAHAPFGCYETGRPDVLEYAISIYKNMILFLDRVGCKYVVIHGISKKELWEETQEEIDALNRHLYESLIPILQQTKQITVCLENLFSGTLKLARGYWEGHCSDPHLACELIDSLNEKAGKKCFGLCLDTGHLNLLRKPMHSYIPIVGDRIVCLHIHDNLQNADSHLIPYAGSIWWKFFLEEMRKIGYKGDLSFETFAQVDKKRLPPELLPAFLSAIADIGKYFRKEIQK